MTQKITIRKTILRIFRFKTSFLIPALFYYSSLFAQWGGASHILNNNDSLWHSRPKIAMREDGGFYTAWTKENPWYVYFPDSTYASPSYATVQSFDSAGNIKQGWSTEGFSIGEVSNQDTLLIYEPQIVTSEDGGVIMACHGYRWDTVHHNTKQIFIQKYDINGNALWNNGKPVQVSTDSTINNRKPQLISDGEMGAVVIWKGEKIDNNANTDLFIRRIDKNGNVASGWTSKQVAVANDPAKFEAYPHIILSADKSAIYVYYHSHILDPRIIITRIRISDGSFDTGYSLNNGLNLTPNVSNTFARISTGFDPGLFMDKDGNLTVIWRMAWSNGMNEDFIIQRIKPDKSLVFPAGGKQLKRKLGTSFTDFGSYSFARDVDCNIWMTWCLIQEEGTGYDVLFLNKLDKNGNWVWEKDFRTNKDYYSYPTVTPDGEGGAFVISYQRDALRNYLRAIRIDSTGSTCSGWTLPGSLFKDPDNYSQVEPKLDYVAASIRGGNAVVLWNRVEDNPRAYEGQTWMIEGCNVIADGSTCVSSYNQGDLLLRTNCSDDVSSVEDEISESELINIYPNPFSSEFEIHYKNTDNKPYTIILSDMPGRTILIKEIKRDVLKIESKELKSGIYILTIIQDNIITIRKKIIKK